MSGFLYRSPPDSYNIAQGVILILQKMTSHVFTFRIPRKNKLIQQIQWKQIQSRSVLCAILVFVSFVFYSFPLLSISTANTVLFSYFKNDFSCIHFQDSQEEQANTTNTMETDTKQVSILCYISICILCILFFSPTQYFHCKHCVILILQK